MADWAKISVQTLLQTCSGLLLEPPLSQFLFSRESLPIFIGSVSGLSGPWVLHDLYGTSLKNILLKACGNHQRLRPLWAALLFHYCSTWCLPVSERRTTQNHTLKLLRELSFVTWLWSVQTAVSRYMPNRYTPSSPHIPVFFPPHLGTERGLPARKICIPRTEMTPTQLMSSSALRGSLQGPGAPRLPPYGWGNPERAEDREEKCCPQGYMASRHKATKQTLHSCGSPSGKKWHH